MQTKIVDTIRSSVQKLGVLAVGEELSDAEFRDGLVALNRVVDNYSTNGIFIGHTVDFAYEAPYVVNRCEVPPPTDITRKWKNKITFGKCGDYDTFKPLEFTNLFFRQSNTDYPLSDMSENEYEGIAVKNVSAIPSRYLYKYIENSLSAIYFDYIPQDNLVFMGSAKVKYTGTNSKGEPFNALDVVNWDEGIEAMIMYRLALELAPDYGIKDVQLVAGLLEDIESKIRLKDAPDYTMSVEDSYQNGGKRAKDLRYNRARY